jgi:antitoxin component YwqK of YwqJK toxin-antitoxin module
MTLISMHALLVVLVLVSATRRVTDDQGCNKGIDENNQLDGEIVCTWPDGTRKYEGLYKAGKREGVQKTYRQNGKLARLETYKNGELDGPSKEYDRDTTLEEDCLYRAGKRHGLCKLYGGAGALREERHYVDGQQQGPFTGYWPSGAVREKGTLDAQGGRHGLFERFLESGVKEVSATYVHGLREGVEREWNSAGKPRREMTWKAGQAHGLAKLFHDDGQLAETLCYQRGQRVVGTNPCTGKKGPEVVTRFGVNGKPAETTTIVEGKRHGESRRFDKKGSLELVEQYVDDHLEGVQKIYDGKWLKAATSFKRGAKDGPETRYFPNGKVSDELTWKEGELIGQATWWMNGKKRTDQVKQNGVWKRSQWYDNGQLETEFLLSIVRGNEYKESTEKRWSVEGVLLEERTWTSGKLDGVQRTFFPKSGKPLSEEMFKLGTRTARKEWDEAGALVKDEQYHQDGSRK